MAVNDGGDPSLSPLNPAHSQGLDGGPGLPSHLNNMESRDLTEEEEAYDGDEHMEEQTMRLQTPWPVTTGEVLTSRHSMSHTDTEISSTMHDALSHPSSTGLLLHQPSSSAHLDTHSSPSHQSMSGNHSESQIHHESQYDAPPAYDASALGEIYQPAPPPTLADAEDAINKLINFLDTSGRGIIQSDERQVLNTIKCALFQAASGVPFDRGQQ